MTRSCEYLPEMGPSARGLSDNSDTEDIEPPTKQPKPMKHEDVHIKIVKRERNEEDRPIESSAGAAKLRAQKYSALSAINSLQNLNATQSFASLPKERGLKQTILNDDLTLPKHLDMTKQDAEEKYRRMAQRHLHK